MMQDSDLILTLNAGSSSVKFSAFALGDDGLHLLVSGQIEGIGACASFTATSSCGTKSAFAINSSRGPVDHRLAVTIIVEWLDDAHHGKRVVAVGHRVVHGGIAFAEPVILNDTILVQLDRLVPLAPLHQPHNLAGIEAAQHAFPGTTQVACFDTAFHRSHPYVADAFALPRRFYDEGVRRYGFHGLSYEYIARQLRVVAPVHAVGRVIVAHLGNGASICAMRDGTSVASTMGFTALDGLPMGTRCGQLDPGVVLYLITEKGMSPAAVSDLLYKESGLKGLSGLSHDMRLLEASDSEDTRHAIAYFVARVRREIAGLAATIGGVDAIVFTGGIGENASNIRAQILSDLGWMGVSINLEANRSNHTTISDETSKVAVFVLKTNEELMIAEHTCDIAGFLRTSSPSYALSKESIDA